MSYKRINLESISKSTLNTEIRYIAASARVKGIELLELVPLQCEDERLTQKGVAGIIRALSQMRHEGIIKLYVRSDKISDGSVESEFLLNKFSEYLTNSEPITVYVLI